MSKAIQVSPHFGIVAALGSSLMLILSFVEVAGLENQILFYALVITVSAVLLRTAWQRACIRFRRVTLVLSFLAILLSSLFSIQNLLHW